LSLVSWFIARKVRRKEKRSPTMGKIMQTLRGKKTYITALLIGITAFLKAIDIDMPDNIYEVLFALGLVSLRAGISKAER